MQENGFKGNVAHLLRDAEAVASGSYNRHTTAVTALSNSYLCALHILEQRQRSRKDTLKDLECHRRKYQAHVLSHFPQLTHLGDAYTFLNLTSAILASLIERNA